jgi:hypothetical protein
VKATCRINARTHLITGLLLSALFCGFGPAAFTQSVVTVMNNGDPQNRVDIAILGDGYTAGEMSKYAADVQTVINGFFSGPPFNEYQRYFNVHRVDVVSSESGADHPELSPPVYKITAFDSSFNCSGIERLLCVNNAKVLSVASSVLSPAQRDFILVIVNDSKYGGSGGQLAVFSTNVDLVELALHEEGHSFGSLGDEYDYSPPPCDTSSEPPEPDITMEVRRGYIKWAAWIDSSTAIPTYTSGYGIPGLYPGAQYCSASKSPPLKYRPTYNSKMRNLYMPFEQVNTEQLIKRVYNWVSPIDSATPAVSSVTIQRGRNQTFSITTPRPLTHDLNASWLLDNQVKGSGLEFTLDSTALTAGSHTVKATVEDHTDMVRNDPSKVLTEQRSWNINVKESSGVVMALNAGGAATASTAGVTGETRTGYADITVNSGSVPFGTAVFSFKQNGITVAEAGVPPSVPTNRARIFIDYRSDVPGLPGRSNAGTVNINTGIVVVNRGASTANLIYTLRDRWGLNQATGHGTIAKDKHIACFIDQLQQVAAADFNLPLNFQTDIQFGSLEISSDQPVSVLALRGTTNQRDEFLITTTPVADLTPPFFVSNLYFPHFVDGGGYTTSLLLLNREAESESGTIQILDSKGQPLVVTRADGTTGSSFPYSISPNGVFHFQTDGSADALKDGWVQVIPDSTSTSPIGAGVLSLNSNGAMITETGIPSAESTTHARIYVDLSEAHNTGLAIANMTNSGAYITIRAFQKDGVTAAGTSKGPLQLDAHGHAAAFANEFIAGLPDGFTGVIDISTNAAFAALTLRSTLNENDDFLMTTFPVANASRPAGSPVLFPHIADGGGYSTEVILISPVGASNSTLRFYGEDGTALDLGK